MKIKDYMQKNGCFLEKLALLLLFLRRPGNRGALHRALKHTEKLAGL